MFDLNFLQIFVIVIRILRYLETRKWPFDYTLYANQKH